MCVWLCVVNMVAVNEVSAEDATTEPKHLLDPLIVLIYRIKIYICSSSSVCGKVINYALQLLS